MNWADLVAEVRAQIDVSDDQAYDWLLDRARVMNAAAGEATTETHCRGSSSHLPSRSTRHPSG